jgi:hypothetical protein
MKTLSLIRVGALLIAGVGCADQTSAPAPDPDQQIAEQVASALIAACPLAAASDETARASCAAKLSGDKALAAIMNEPFLWGGQKAGTTFNPAESNMNRFNILVWRRMYLSLMMFTGESRIEKTADGLTVVHLPVRFRNELEPGSYPYPFWHAAKKWESYELSKEIVALVKGGKWIGAMRAAEQDTARARVSHTWSGQWTWQEGEVVQPYVTMYSYLFSKENPHISRLDSAYKDLSNGMRQHACVMCHSPDNFGESKELEFFNYPNQALYSRHSIIAQLQINNMPPVENGLGLAHGIADAEERQSLIAMAKEFESAGDAALAFEGELKR